MYQLLYVVSTWMTYCLVTFAVLAIVIIITTMSKVINNIIISREYNSCWKMEAAEFFNGAAAAGQMLLSFCFVCFSQFLLFCFSQFLLELLLSVSPLLLLSKLPLFLLPPFEISCINETDLRLVLLLKSCCSTLREGWS